MLPPPAAISRKRVIGIYVHREAVDRAAAIAKSEKVRSRSGLLSSFLEFAIEVFPLLKPMSAGIEAVMREERCSYAEAIARLVERGLRSRR